MKEFDQAMEAVRDEMARNPGNPAIQQLGEMLTQRLQHEPGIAGKVISHKDGLSAVYKDMQAKARTRARGGCAVLTSEDAMEIMEKYYGLEKAEESASFLYENDVPVAKTADPLDLDALMG